MERQRSLKPSKSDILRKKQKQNQAHNNEIDTAKNSYKKILTILGSLVPEQHKLTQRNEFVQSLTKNEQNIANESSKGGHPYFQGLSNQQNKNGQPESLRSSVSLHQIQSETNQNNELQKKFFNFTTEPNLSNKYNKSSAQIGDQVFKKLLNMTSNLALQTTNSNTQQIHQGYFKDNIIKVDPKQCSNQSSQPKQDHQITSLWLGQVFDRCTSSSFMHYISRNLDYNETKTYCCEQILSNLIQAIRDGKTLKTVKKLPSIETIERNLPKKSQFRKKIVYENQPMKYINEEASRILDYLCHKYPQTDIQGVNKQVAELAKSLKIDNWMDDQYDILRQSEIKFKHKESGDYSKEIMEVINFLIQLPFKQHKRYSELTNYKYFELVMNKIFEIVYYKESKNDINSVINDAGEIDLFLRSKANQTQEEIEYREKVKSYTTVLIGSKIPGTVKTFSQEEIASGIIKVEHNAVARVIDKWAEELGSKFFKAEKHVLKRIYRFKSADDKRFFKISQETREELFKIMNEKKKSLQKFTDELRQSIYDLSNKLAKNEFSDVSQLYFLDQRQKRVGEFAVKMAQSSSQYFIQIIQKEISLLLESINQMKKNWVSKYKFKQSPAYEALNINLITFKIGDLMRCKIISNEEEIIRVLNVFKTLSEMWNQKFIKIIRVKNRLQSGTRDILIHFMFDEICPCELQLAVAEKITQKQQYFDKFNHFLYELKRAYLGPVMEMCKIWNQFESKSQTYAKQIEKSTKKKLKQKKMSKQFLDISFQSLNHVYEYKFPFVCVQCNTFTPRNTLIFFNSLIFGKIYCGNCIKNKIYLELGDISGIKKQYIFKKYLIRYPNMQKLLCHLRQIANFEEGIKKKFQVHVPVKSHTIHMIFSMIVKLDREEQNDVFDEYAFVSTKFLKDGSLQQQICNQKIAKQKQKSNGISMMTMNELEEQLGQDYIFYGWDAPTELLPLPQNTNGHYLQLIEKFLPFIRKLQQEKGHYNVKIGAIEIQPKKYYYFPFFVIDQIKMSQQLIQKSNIQIITNSLDHKQEILQISNRKITSEWNELSQGARLKVAHTVREIYLNQNLLKSIDFVEHLHMLKIFQANKNQIQKIPNIPLGLQQLKLDENRLIRINNFNANENEDDNFKLHSLSLAGNQISKIENINNLKNLRNLSLYKNKIKKIEGLPAGLERLALMQNQIENIENMAHLKNLRNVSLSSNLITKIQNLEECTSLTTIVLNRNNIRKIEGLSELQNLRTIHLSFTGLDSALVNDIQNDYYEGLRELKKIKKLMMEGNKISCLLHILGLVEACQVSGQIKINTSNPYIHLEEISLADNEIYCVQHFQQIMPLVSIVNLQKNRITQMNNILKFTMLVQLNLSQNLIENLPDSGWQKLFKIRCLNLSHNKIKRIPNLKYLLFSKYLHFGYNQITCVQSFPMYPYGIPDFVREINMQNNLLFAESTSEQDFKKTLRAMTQLNQESNINLTQNGLCKEKLEKAEQIKEDYELKNTLIV